MSEDVLNTRYVLGTHVVMEGFADAALVFLPEQKRLVRVNRTTEKILLHLDGEFTTREVVDALVENYDIGMERLESDLVHAILDLASMNVIKNCDLINRMKGVEKMSDTRYVVNHDVVCRVEDEDGAILFEPETDRTRVINPTGLVIWQAMETPSTKKLILEHVVDSCEGVPEDKVVEEVDEFVDMLVSSGFAGEVKA